MSHDKAINVTTTKNVAALLMLDPRRIQQLAKDGWFEQVSRGKWSLVDVVQGYIRFLKDADRQSAKSASVSRATDARTREIELRIARQEGKFVPVDEFEFWFEEVTGEFLASFTSLPTRITRNKRERDRIELICDQERSRLVKSFGKRRSAFLKGNVTS